MGTRGLGGQLARRAVLELVLGRTVGDLLPHPQGVMLGEVSSEDCARLEFYAAAVGIEAMPCADGDCLIQTSPRAELAVELARAVMAGFGKSDPVRQHRRLAQIAVRADSRLRAMSEDIPADYRFDPKSLSGDVDVKQHREVYAHFFSVEEYDLRFRRFDGSFSPVVNRAAFISGDAATVLPYDPKRDRVLLIEQFRAGCFARGDKNPWSLEAIAGRIDAGETPEDAARREAVEEAGLTLSALEKVSQYYASPGAKSEYLYSYVAVVDLPDDAAGVFGMEGEAEDIRGHLIERAELQRLIATGEIGNAPLVLSALWLELNYRRLQAEAA